MIFLHYISLAILWILLFGCLGIFIFDRNTERRRSSRLANIIFSLSLVGILFTALFLAGTPASYMLAGYWLSYGTGSILRKPEGEFIKPGKGELRLLAGALASLFSIWVLI